MENLNTYIFISLMGIMLLLVIIASFFVDKKHPFVKKFGINLKRVYCPNCNKKLPLIRKPENTNQALYGGWTCEKCNSKIDKFGNLIK